ncbi:MAG: hypothetical protein IPO83_03825 [Chitinophagaceae bacterium]|nr:hypothetical protein [Chitinophagaceae bacterium]
MPIQKFSPPAYIQDLNETLKDAWSNIIDNWYKQAIRYLRESHGIPNPYLFNLLEHPEAENGPVREIPWNGYPRKYKLVFPNQDERWRMTESVVNRDLNGRSTPYRYLVNGNYIKATDIFFRDQDEYCEWKSFYDPVSNHLKKIVFTCENPEYWTFIAENDRQLLLAKYREITGENVVMDDLFSIRIFTIQTMTDSMKIKTAGIIRIINGIVRMAYFI